MRRLALDARPRRTTKSASGGRRWLAIGLSLLLALFLAADDPDNANGPAPPAASPAADSDNSDVKNAPEDSAPEDSAPEDSAPEDSAPEDSAPGDSAARERPASGDPVSEDPVGRVRRAYLVPVSLPIAGEEDTRLKRVIDKLVSSLPEQGPRPVLILEFRSQPGQAGDASQFERSLSLARYLAGPRMSRVETVAYLPGSVRGHAVLVAMACEGLVTSDDAELGAAGIREEFVDPTMRRGYAEIASRRRTIPEAVALGMLDRQLAVYRVDTLDGVRFVLADELETLRAQGAFSEAETLSPAGDFVTLRGDRLRELGFASHLVGSRAELAAALKLPVSAIQEDPSLATGWRAVRVDLRGRVSAGQVNQILRDIQESRQRDQVNFICLWIDSPGGSPADSLRLAQALADLDGSQVRTVAFVQEQARGDAVLPAFACDQTILRENALLGGPGDHFLTPSELDDLREPVQRLAEAKGRDWSLPLGMLDHRLEVFRYREAGTGEERFFSEEEVGDRPGWERGERLSLQRGVLAREAETLGLAQGVVRDYGELIEMYNLESEPQTMESGWAEAALERLAAQPWFARTLLFIAFFALMSEASTPGLGAAGFISGVCFMLFFWCQFLNGSAGWLEVLLFVGGATCIAIEILAIPGFGIFGIGGGAMVILSIVLASQTFVIPQNSYQLRQVPSSLFMVVFAAVGALTALIIMRRAIRDAPILNRLMLRPPVAEELDELERREAIVSWSHLQGKPGVAITQLTPSGKARFGDDVVDVISDGELLERGSNVYVVEVRGNRVLVAPLDRPTTA